MAWIGRKYPGRKMPSPGRVPNIDAVAGLRGLQGDVPPPAINAPISFDPVQGAYGRDLALTNPSAARWIDMMSEATGGRGRIRPSGDTPTLGLGPAVVRPSQPPTTADPYQTPLDGSAPDNAQLNSDIRQRDWRQREALKALRSRGRR